MNNLNQKDVKLIAELKTLLKQIDCQRTIYNLNYNSDYNRLEYRTVYNLNDICNNFINLTEENLKQKEVVSLLETILLRYSLLKHKTRENINSYLVNEYISSIIKSNMPLDIVDEIDKNVLLMRLKERRNDIVNFLDYEIATRVVLTTIENITLTSIASLIDEKIATYLLLYTLSSPIFYSVIPHKIDTIINKSKYNKIVSKLEKSDYKQPPVLKMFCVVNKKIHEIEDEDNEYFKEEIKALKEILEDCYKKDITSSNTINPEIIDKIEDLYNKVNIKRLKKKTSSIVEFKPKQLIKEKNINNN